MKLSQSAIRDAKAGDVLKCAIVPGLQLRFRSATRPPSWCLYYRDPTTRAQCRPKLGNYPALTIEAAREVARAWLRQVASGTNPGAERQAKRAAPTVAEALEQFRSDGMAALRPRTRAEYNSTYDRFLLPVLGRKKVADVTAADLEALFRRIAERGFSGVRETREGPKRVVWGGPIAANRARVYVSALLSYCELERVAYRPRGSNPINETTKRTERKRKRHVRAGEFPALVSELKRLANSRPADVAAVWVLIYSGARVSEVAEARRANLVGNKLILGPDEHKTGAHTGDERTVRLPVQAVAMLEALPVCYSGKLFGQRCTRWTVSEVWRCACAAAGIEGLQLRDTRRTFASAAKSAGASLHAIGELLGHTVAETTAGYAWLFDEAAEALTQSTADQIESLSRGPSDAPELPRLPVDLPTSETP